MIVSLMLLLTIFDHEMKHLHVNKNVLERNLPVFEEHLLNGMKYFSSKYGQGPFKLKELPKIKYNFYQYMQASLDTAANLATEDIKAAQKRVDTKEEYQRVSSLCRWGIPSTNNPTSNLPYTGIPPNNSNNPSGSFNSGR
jgi:hypothetical protein